MVTLWRRTASLASSFAGLALVAAGLSLAVPGTARVPLLAESWWPVQFLITTLSYLVTTNVRWGWSLSGAMLLVNLAPDRGALGPGRAATARRRRPLARGRHAGGSAQRRAARGHQPSGRERGPVERSPVTITASDAGVGFAPDAADGRRGVRGSIAARLDDIGGSASIASVPGRGTLVELRWTPVQRTAFAPRVIGGGAISRIFPFVLLTDPDLAAHLAPRELEVLRLLGEGVPRKSIGRRLDPPVSLTTYLDRVRDRYRALGRTVDTPADAVRATTADG